jgi:predicted GNAT superfamily acetyltransferase
MADSNLRNLSQEPQELALSGHMTAEQIEIRECTRLEEMAECVRLQRAVFALPETELSPVRHFVVTKNAGGFTLGAFLNERLIAFVLSVPAFLRGDKAFYSHMTAVDPEYQGTGIGARIKWAQRKRSLELGVRSIKWTFEPVKARNAYFNLEKLGAVVREYEPNFYGTDYTSGEEKIGLASDRLFAEWELESEKVTELASGNEYIEHARIAREISIPADWPGLVRSDARAAVAEQVRIKYEFEAAFADGLICRGFQRDAEMPKYLLFEE